MKDRTFRRFIVLLFMLTVLFAGCHERTLSRKLNYDTGITAESIKNDEWLSEEFQAALDGRLEAYNLRFHESLERSLSLPVLQLCLEGNTITLRPKGMYLSLCVDDQGKTAQCVFAGTLKGDIQRGYGGDWKRYSLEVRWAEDADLFPLAYVDLGCSSFTPVLLVQGEQELRVLWYADSIALCYSGDGYETDYQSSVTGDTSWSLESLEMLMEGYERYLEMCKLHPANYLELQWLSQNEFQAGLRKQKQ